MLASRAQLGKHELAREEELIKNLEDAAIRFEDAAFSLKGELVCICRSAYTARPLHFSWQVTEVNLVRFIESFVASSIPRWTSAPG